MQPKTLIYNPAFAVSLPIGLSITNGMNAIAHNKTQGPGAAAAHTLARRGAAGLIICGRRPGQGQAQVRQTPGLSLFQESFPDIHVVEGQSAGWPRSWHVLLILVLPCAGTGNARSRRRR